MPSLKQIEDFISAEPVAIVGVSRDPKKFGQMAFKELKNKGLNVIPVNLSAEEILGVKAYPNITALPPEVRGVVIMTKKDQTADLVREAKAKGLKNIWIQQAAESKEALKELEGSDINYITGECILMYYKPHSVHKFHKTLKKFFGRFPR
jgi:predicted CoA-binding protein